MNHIQVLADDATRERRVAATPERTLGELTISTKDTGFRYHLDAMGTLDESGGMILILSAIASESAIKALRACLHRAAKAEFRADCQGFNRHTNLQPCGQGYRFHAAKLGPGTWHALALAKSPGLIPKLSNDSLWAELQRNGYTTPLLPAWLGWLRTELESRGHLKRLHSFQCDGAVLDLTSEALDELVSDGLRQKHITI